MRRTIFTVGTKWIDENGDEWVKLRDVQHGTDDPVGGVLEERDITDEVGITPAAWLVKAARKVGLS